jgi:hypothetical protein
MTGQPRGMLAEDRAIIIDYKKKKKR